MNVAFDAWWQAGDVERVASLLDQSPKQIAEAAWCAALGAVAALRKGALRPDSYDEGWDDAIDAATARLAR